MITKSKLPNCYKRWFVSHRRQNVVICRCKVVVVVVVVVVAFLILKAEPGYLDLA